MANDNIIESIHRFLLDDMEGDERTTFEKEMVSNEAIKKQITMEQRFLKGIEYVADAELKSNISNVHHSLKQKGFFKEVQTGGAKIINMKRRNTSRLLFAVAAALVALIAAWFVFNNGGGTDVDTEGIYANYYQMEKSITNTLIDKTNPSFIDPSDSKNKQLYLALDQYQNGDYKAALNYLNGLIKEFPEDKHIVFYMGLSNIGIGNTDEAIKLLAPLTDSGFEYQDAAKWYLSLSFIKNNELREAKKLLTDLVKNNNSSYSEKAKNLLADLSK